MTKKIQYTFNNGDNITTVDRDNEIISTDERGGWSRSYHITFKDLLKSAKYWDVKVELTSPDKVLAKIATKIILANNVASQGGDPFRYIPRSKKVTAPNDLEILKGFEAILKQYGSTQVISQLSAKSQKSLKEALGE